MAFDILSIPAMSADAEWVFSGARRTISWDRMLLGAATIEKGECLKSWIQSGITRRLLSRSAAILTLILSRSSKFEVRSFESLNSGLRHGGLDPKSEVQPEALGARFGRFDYSGRRFPIGGPLPPFYRDRISGLVDIATYRIDPIFR